MKTMTNKGTLKPKISEPRPVKAQTKQKGRSMNDGVREPKIVGYARISTDDQDAALQVDALKKIGVKKPNLFVDEGWSGTLADRPALDTALKSLRAGDTLIVWKLDRLGRSLLQLLTISENLRERKIRFRSLTEGIDTETASGRLLYSVLGAVAAFERDVLVERTRAGMRAAKSRGIHVGRPQALAGSRLDMASDMLREGRTKREVARILRVSVDTVTRALAKRQAS